MNILQIYLKYILITYILITNPPPPTPHCNQKGRRTKCIDKAHGYRATYCDCTVYFETLQAVALSEDADGRAGEAAGCVARPPRPRLPGRVRSRPDTHVMTGRTHQFPLPGRVRYAERSCAAACSWTS